MLQTSPGEGAGWCRGRQACSRGSQGPQGETWLMNSFLNLVDASAALYPPCTPALCFLSAIPLSRITDALPTVSGCQSFASFPLYVDTDIFTIISSCRVRKTWIIGRGRIALRFRTRCESVNVLWRSLHCSWGCPWGQRIISLHWLGF